ncbi:UDENN domain-containing protein [Aphelenchoides besseyi]|nr:UDENN domain-containing protein [Aphelenchoides besseyi]
MVELQNGDYQNENDSEPLISPSPEMVKIRKSSEMNSTLIKRARLIRRSTTNHYCEELKRLKREDGSLIRQVLIVSLQLRPTTNDSRESNGLTYWPVITFSHPPLDDKKHKFQAPIFFPDFQSCVQKDEHYQLILTDDKGDRSVAFCYKFLPKSTRSASDFEINKQSNKKERCSVLVLISNLSNESLFFQLANNFVQECEKDPARAVLLSEELLKIRISDSEVGQQPLKRVRSIIGRPEPRNTVAHVSSLMQTIGVEDTVFALLCMLNEKRIIVTGSNVSDVSRAVQTFVRLLSPLDWPYTLIPVVPDTLIDVCHCPMPYIAGMLRCNLNKIADLIVPLPGSAEDEQVVIIDVERGLILPCLSLQSLRDTELRSKALLNIAAGMGFPKSLVSELLTSLRSVFPIKSLTKADEKISKRICVWYARIFGHYQAFGSSLLSARDRKRLAMSHPCSDYRKMLQWFVETGLLQFFFNQNTTQNGTSAAQLERFHSTIKKFAPPVSNQKGKRRKARSLLWRLLNH